MSFKERFERHFGLGVAAIWLAGIGSGIAAYLTVLGWASITTIRQEEKLRLEQQASAAVQLQIDLAAYKDRLHTQETLTIDLQRQLSELPRVELRARFEEEMEKFVTHYADAFLLHVIYTNEPDSKTQQRHEAEARLARLIGMAKELHIEREYAGFFQRYGHQIESPSSSVPTGTK